jgi:hyperosmotically inducible protein
MKLKLACVLLLLSLAGCKDGTRTVETEAPNATETASVERDNSAVNVRDREETAKTPIDQNENQKDIDTTANIRARVVDTNMSVDAQNVKIITQNGKVTLRGPVATAAEKTQIEEMAIAVAGQGNVDNQLEVQP